jgi:hypothetical protein
MPNVNKQLDRVEMGEEQRNQTLGTQYRLSSCEINYWCAHGQELDSSDNASFSASKPISDAMVNLGIERDDKDFKTKATQRLHRNNSDI